MAVLHAVMGGGYPRIDEDLWTLQQWQRSRAEHPFTTASVAESLNCTGRGDVLYSFVFVVLFLMCCISSSIRLFFCFVVLLT